MADIFGYSWEDIQRAQRDGLFFVVTYGRASAGEWPQSWKDVTKKTAQDLPQSFTAEE